MATREHELANLRKNIVRKTALVLVDTGITHLVGEKLGIINMTGSAGGTKEKPGKRVAQKGLNKSILGQGWGMLFWCVLCGFIHHADCNAGCNIENRRRILGLARRTITSLVQLPATTGLRYWAAGRGGWYHCRPYG